MSIMHNWQLKEDENFQSMRKAFLKSVIDEHINTIDSEFRNENFNLKTNPKTRLKLIRLKSFIKAQSDLDKIESNTAYCKMLQKIYNNNDKRKIKQLIQYLPEETKDFIYKMYYKEYDFLMSKVSGGQDQKNLENNKKFADFILTEVKNYEFNKIIMDNERYHLDHDKDTKMKFQKLNEEYNKQKNEQKPCVTEGYVEMIKNLAPGHRKQVIKYIPQDVRDMIMGKDKIKEYKGISNIDAFFRKKKTSTGEKVLFG